MEMEFVAGLMEECTKENGRITTWKASASTNGTTADSMKVSTKMIKSTVMVFTSGQTEESTKATGTEVNSMASELITYQKTRKPSVASGKTEKESSGSRITK